MKRIVSASMVLVSALLSGCAGGTPDCGDGETMDLIHNVIVGAVEKRVTWYESSAEAKKYMDMFNVESFRKIPDNYEVSKIRVLRYDKDTDVYECEASITYDYQSGRERTFRYRVETDQGDSQTLLSYEKSMLGPIF
ncbi:hypothetical protein [Xanthomonas euroxanthea]|uniref:hypothetical protein n=1 Tax=Xanthomonas euroxanthea TaxID=2259622 RepID=UPI00160A6CDD|nr:hypothetical protein [Xanthomonas euroxanthea]MBB5766513.1 hypothetical protein [Xanthomonas euroxanthea]